MSVAQAQTSSILLSIALVVVWGTERNFTAQSPRFSFMPLMDLAAHIGGLLMGTGPEIPLACFLAESSRGS